LFACHIHCNEVYSSTFHIRQYSQHTSIIHRESYVTQPKYFIPSWMSPSRNAISVTSSLRTALIVLLLLVLTPWWNVSTNVAHFSKCLPFSFSFVRKDEHVCQQNIVVMWSKTVSVNTRYSAAHNKSNIQYTGPIGFPTSASLFSVPICKSSNEFVDLEIKHWIWKYIHSYICCW